MKFYSKENSKTLQTIAPHPSFKNHSIIYLKAKNHTYICELLSLGMAKWERSLRK